jgi:hypothetical protein
MVNFLTILSLVSASTIALAAPAADAPKVPPDLLKAKEKEFPADEKLGVDAEGAYKWSCRWLEAERQVSDNKEDRIAAAQAHLDRMKALKKRAHEVAARNSADVNLPGTEYYCVEAEIWLVQAKGP